MQQPDIPPSPAPSASQPRPRQAGGPPTITPQPKHRSLWRELPVLVVIAFVVALLIKSFVLQAFYIPSASMEPTLSKGDRVLVNKVSYDLHDVHRGDVIVFKGPEQAEGQVKDLIKRVIGLPGDTVEARPDGLVYVNGQPIDEPYLGPGITTGPLEPQTIPPKHYWVMGDNRGNSKDSRFFGPIDESLIIGRAFVKVWPIQHFRLL
ncbi:MAG: signal peptidase I [Acidimicrobiales bacterium]